MGDVLDWNEYARCYDAICTLTPYQAMLHSVCAALAIQPEEQVLDAGCGTGNITQQLVQEKGVKICALDYSSEMLHRAEEKCKDGNVSFIQYNLNSPLPFASGIFDAVVCVNVLYALTTPHKVLNELRRVLSSHGRIVLVTPKKGYENGYILKEHCGSNMPDEHWLNVHSSVQRERKLITQAVHDPVLVEQFIMVAHWNRIIAQSMSTHLFTDDELHALLRQSGFSDVVMSYTYAEQNLLAVAQ